MPWSLPGAPSSTFMVSASVLVTLVAELVVFSQCDIRLIAQSSEVSDGSVVCGLVP